MNVQSILSRKGTAVATVQPGATLAQATASLRDHGVGALVVSANGRTIDGILSERDVVRALAAHGGGTLGREVSSAMSANVVVCQPDDTVDQLMAMMTDRRIRHLPVLDGAGEMAGIISIGDVVKRRIEDAVREAEEIKTYIATA